jgi:hypothetical protein
VVVFLGEGWHVSVFSWTVIATTGRERFIDFAPYVASVNDAGTVVFQATLRGGGKGVFTGSVGRSRKPSGSPSWLASRATPTLTTRAP